MTLLLLVAGLSVVAGGGLAVGAAGLTGALGGLLGVLIVVPLIADPAPTLLPIAVRAVGALLAVELLWVGLQRSPELRRPSPLGLPALMMAGLAAAIAGLALPTLTRTSPVLGEFLVDVDALAVARATSLALLVVALPTLVGRSPAGSTGIGAIVLLAAGDLLLGTWTGPRSPLDHLLASLVGVVLAGATVTLAWRLPVGPPLAGRSPADGATPVDDSTVAPPGGRRRIPIWPGVRSVPGWARRRPPTP